MKERTPRTWTRKELDQARAMRQQGMSHKEIAKVLGRSWMAVKIRLYEARCTLRIHRLTEKKRKKIRSWVKQGLTQAQMARKLGVGNQTMSRWCKRMNLKPRRGKGGLQNSEQYRRAAMTKLENMRYLTQSLGWPEAQSIRECQILETLYQTNAELTRKELKSQLGGWLRNSLRRLVSLGYVVRLGTRKEWRYQLSPKLRVRKQGVNED